MLRNQINRLLFENGMSESELATRTHIDQSHLNRIKNGHVEPSLVTALRIAEGLGFKVESVFSLEASGVLRALSRPSPGSAKACLAERPGTESPVGEAALRAASAKRGSARQIG